MLDGLESHKGIERLESDPPSLALTVLQWHTCRSSIVALLRMTAARDNEPS